LIFYGISGTVTTIIHEIGHLFSALLTGGKNFSLDFNLFTASYANWGGEHNCFTTLGGPIITIISSFPSLILFLNKRFGKKTSFNLKIFNGVFLISAITSTFFYILFSIFIEWGDGYTLVRYYNFPKTLLIFSTFVLGILSLFTFLKRLDTDIKNMYGKSVNTLIVLLSVVFTVFVFKFVFGEPFKYTHEYILVTYFLFGVIILLNIKFNLKKYLVQKPIRSTFVGIVIIVICYAVGFTFIHPPTSNGLDNPDCPEHIPSSFFIEYDGG
jgi:hypothetical protein